MQSFEKVSSQLVSSNQLSSLDQLEINQISPGRKRSKNNQSISPISPEFFAENLPKLEINDDSPSKFVVNSSIDTLVEGKNQSIQTISQNAALSPRERSPFRARRDDIFNLERPAISSKKLSSSSEFGINESSPSMNPIIQLTSSINDLKLPNSEKSIKKLTCSTNDLTEQLPAKNRTYEGQTRLNESQCMLKQTLLAITQVQGQALEQQAEFFKNQIVNNITSLIDSSKETEITNDPLMLIETLKALGSPNKSPATTRLISLALGKAILQPTNPEDIKKLVKEYINEGIYNPKVCAEEMWRSMECTKIYHFKSDTPIIDGAKINQEDKLRDKEISTYMGNALNLLFQHVSNSNHEFISAQEFGESLIDAGVIGISFAERLKKKCIDNSKIMTMQLILGLGKQELFTLPATWTIPKEFLTVGGTHELIVSEYNPTFEGIMKPLQYNRQISIKLLEDGGLDYIVEQPITFKDRESKEPLGTCRLQTTLSFDKEMSCIFQEQEVKAASIFEYEIGLICSNAAFQGI